VNGNRRPTPLRGRLVRILVDEFKIDRAAPQQIQESDVKILFWCAFFTACVSPYIAAGAEVSGTNEFSGAKEGVGILMKLNPGTNDGGSKRPFTIIVTVTNNSLDEVYLGWPTVVAPIWFTVTLPSGKDFSTPEPGAQMMGSATTTPVLRAHEVKYFTFQLNNIVPLAEAGMYRYSAKVRVFHANSNFVATSDPVGVSLSDADINALRRSSGGFLK
jgi:hypothetical protein